MSDQFDSIEKAAAACESEEPAFYVVMNSAGRFASAVPNGGWATMHGKVVWVAALNDATVFSKQYLRIKCKPAVEEQLKGHIKLPAKTVQTIELITPNK